jgi:hypothetical protein
MDAILHDQFKNELTIAEGSHCKDASDYRMGFFNLIKENDLLCNVLCICIMRN